MNTPILRRNVQDLMLFSDSISRRLTAWSILAGLLLFGALAGPYFAGLLYTADDLGNAFLPLRFFYANQLAAGKPFDWMPQLFSGYYLTGEGQCALYHPLYLVLYQLLPLRTALAGEYLLSYPLMMAGMWLLLRRRLGRSDAAAFGALAFTFSTFNLLHFVHPAAIAAVAHMPWLLWAIDLVLTESRRRRVTLAAALIALLTGSQLLLGQPQFVWFSLLLESAYVVFLLTAHKYTARNGCNLCASCTECIGCTVQTWPRILIAKGIGLLIGGVQLLPSIDSWLAGNRAAVSAGFAQSESLHPLNLLQLVAPYMFADRGIGNNSYEFGVYIGVVPLILIVWVLTRKEQLGPLATAAWTGLTFALVMLLLSFGYYGFIDRMLPMLGSFRFPSRYLLLFQFAAMGVAAIGFALVARESIQAWGFRAQHPPLVHRFQVGIWRDFESIWCLVGLSLAVAIAGLTLHNQPHLSSAAAILAGPALLAAAAVLLVAAVRGYPAALVGLIVLAACDLGWYGLTRTVYGHGARLQDYVASACIPPGKPDDRVVASLHPSNRSGQGTGDQMTLFGWSRADGYVALESGRRLDYRFLPALRVASVRWVKRDPTTAVVAGLKSFDSQWFEVPDPLPRVRLVAETRQSADPAADIANICPDTTVLTEVPIGLPASQPGSAVLKSQQPGRLEIQIDCPAEQLLVVADSFHPGWHATVDRQPREVYRVNGDFMGVVVGPGKQNVVLRFQPDSLARGRVTTYLGLSLAAICFLGSLAGPKPHPPLNDLP